jgi:putative protease
MAPAGDWEAMRAAVANGADAVYFGLADFNARHRAVNFTIDQVPQVMAFLRDHNVRGYVAFNTLVFSGELAQAAELIARLAAAAVDAVIVQDLGLLHLIHHMAPAMAVHASTQMTLTDARGIELVRQLGVQRVILPRELSIADIARIHSQTPVQLEAFVHGALCISYSGQCLTSEAMGGRSANRGQCAQACRLPYQLLVDGKPAAQQGQRAYLLSPQDLAAHDRIGQLAQAGVSCFKIEGRLKSAHYVAATTQAYRAAVDAASQRRAFSLPPEARAQLEQSFSRGFGHGFLDGADHQSLVPGLFPKSRGVLAGTVASITHRGLIVQLAGKPPVMLKPGDGVCFDQGHPQQDEQGGRIFVVRPAGAGRVEIELGHGQVNLSAVAVGSKVWRTDDPALRRRLEHSYSRPTIARRLPLNVAVHAAVGRPLEIRLHDSTGLVAQAQSSEPLAAARQHPVTVDLLREQLGRLGDTPYELADVQLTGDGSAMVPKSVLNELRRQAVASLLSQRAKAASVEVDTAALGRLRPPPAQHTPTSPALTVLVRSDEQLGALLEWLPQALLRPAMVYCEFEQPGRYPQAVAALKAAHLPVALVTPRIVKPGEDGLLAQLAACEPDAILVRNLSSIVFFRQQCPQIALLGDYSLNVANDLTASVLLQVGLKRLVPSYDLNLQQLGNMAARMDPGALELVLHQHIPMFHMEHCVFAAALSNNRDYRDCGRSCERHRVELQDRAGAVHPLVADAGCRNTLYNATAQSGAQFLRQLQRLGIGWFRVELLRESAQQMRQILDCYAQILSGAGATAQQQRSLEALHRLGITSGTLGYA